MDRRRNTGASEARLQGILLQAGLCSEAALWHKKQCGFEKNCQWPAHGPEQAVSEIRISAYSAPPLCAGNRPCFFITREYNLIYFSMMTSQVASLSTSLWAFLMRFC